MNFYKCPICQDKLYLEEKTWKCAANHSFDVAKEGYVNLLPVNKKRSKEPGDNKAMLQSRRSFLNQGDYGFLADKLVLMINNCDDKQLNILDLGCGEGYYLEQVRKRLEQIQKAPDVGGTINFAALDISKFAVQMTAKRNKQASCSVASAVDTPYLEQSFDIIYNVFAPYSEVENHRILKPEGRFILIGPGANHLQELSAHIYNDVVSHSGNSKQLQDSQCFSLCNCETLQTQVTIPQNQIENLLAMTPYYWSTSQQQKESLFAMENLTVTLHFQIFEYVKLSC